MYKKYEKYLNENNINLGSGNYLSSEYRNS